MIGTSQGVVSSLCPISFSSPAILCDWLAMAGSQ